MIEHGKTIDVDGAMIGTHSVRAMLARIDELEAELAALKARRCETCKSQEEGLSYCSTLDVLTTEGFYCADWEARR